MSVDCAKMQEKLISNYKHERRATFYVSQTAQEGRPVPTAWQVESVVVHTERGNKNEFKCRMMDHWPPCKPQVKQITNCYVLFFLARFIVVNYFKMEYLIHIQVSYLPNR